jgi:hypothetical protein
MPTHGPSKFGDSPKEPNNMKRTLTAVAAAIGSLLVPFGIMRAQAASAIYPSQEYWGWEQRYQIPFSFIPRPLPNRKESSTAIGNNSTAIGSNSTAIGRSSMVFGNPVVFPALRQQGFSIATSITQTDTTSTVTYSITPPVNYINTDEKMIGQLNFQLLIPDGSEIPIQFTSTYTGLANVIGLRATNKWYAYPEDVKDNNDQFLFGGSYTPNESQPTVSFGPSQIILKAGAGSLFFFLSPSNPQPVPPSSISVTANIGNPQRGRKAYLNDYTGGGTTNFALWRPSEGNWYVPPSELLRGYWSLGLTWPEVITQWGVPGDVPVPGDYDGDGITDYAVWRPSEGKWYVIRSSTGEVSITPWGLPGDVPIAAGDYDGDGRTDYAVWRPSEGNWRVRLNTTRFEVIQQLGVPGDIPLTGNFDGDGKTDYVIWRPSEGNWYVNLSSTGETTIKGWGLPGDVPMPGDFDGDGKTDFAVWRPSEGNWYVNLSSTDTRLLTQWGFPNDIPVSGDFDGDGKTDYVVWRPSEGNWYILNSSTEMEVVQQWGLAGDIPDGRTLTSVPIP